MTIPEVEYYEERVRPYKVENDGTPELMFLRSRVAEMEAGNKDFVFKREFEKSIRTKITRV